MECHPSPRDNAGYTPLHWACAKGHLEIAKLLLLYGANPSESAQGGIRYVFSEIKVFISNSFCFKFSELNTTLVYYLNIVPDRHVSLKSCKLISGC